MGSSKRKKKVFALKLNKLEKKEKRKVLCYCCTCDGISVSRGKKSFVQVMLCTFFRLLLVCVSLLPFFQFSKGIKREFQAYPRKRTVWAKAKSDANQKGKFCCLLCPQMRGFSVFFPIFKLNPFFFLGKGETRKKEAEEDRRERLKSEPMFGWMTEEEIFGWKITLSGKMENLI